MVVLITGASSGIGEATAELLAKNGFTVYGGARRVDKMDSLKNIGVNTRYLDVTDEASCLKVIDEILEKEGRIDVLINNAGFGFYGAVEDVKMDDVRQQLEVNLVGLGRMIQLVLPIMRKNHFGKVINISSMAGKVSTPFGSWYHATKFAVEGLTDSLRLEIAPFGIDAILIEPGAIKTPWGVIAASNLIESSKNGAYKSTASTAAKAFNNLYTGDKITKPDIIAKTILKAILKKRPKTRYLVGYGAKLSVLTRRILPDRGYDFIIKKVFEI